MRGPWNEPLDSNPVVNEIINPLDSNPVVNEIINPLDSNPVVNPVVLKAGVLILLP